MELVMTELGQSLQLIHMDEVRPLRGGISNADLRKAMVERYHFQRVAPQENPDQPIKFEEGVYQPNQLELSIPINSLEIYRDGVIINTRHTDDSDAVLDDYIEWVSVIARLRQPKTYWLPRTYFSRIVVDLSRPAGDTFITNFTAIRSIVSEALDIPENLEPQITFAPEPPRELQASKTWTFQPRRGQPYVPNRYFSAAPLATGRHFDMLCALEAAAAR